MSIHNDRSIELARQGASNIGRPDLEQAQPEQHPQIPPISRTSTAASWWQHLRNRNKASDNFELQLQKRESTTHRNKLLEDYSRIKKKQVDGEFVSSLLYFDTFSPNPRVPPADEERVVENRIAFGERLDEARTQLDSGKITEGSWALFLCVLCCQTPPKLQSQLFKFKSGLFVSNSRLQRMHDTPWLSLLHTIVEKLQVPTRILDTCIEITKELPPELMPFNNVFFSDKLLSPFALSEHDWISKEIHWYASAPDYFREYSSYAWLRDYKVYVWQPQLDRNIFPPQKALVTLSGTTGENTGTRSMMVLLRPNPENTKLIVNFFRGELEKIRNVPAQRLFSQETEIFASMLCLCNMIGIDTKQFIREMLNQVAIMRVEGRRHPSSGKINFALHLDDIRQSAMIGLRGLETLVSDIFQDESLVANSTHLQQYKFRIETDLVAFCTDLQELGEILKDLKEMKLKEQLELQQIGLTAIITVLAAIYLPFSFISGMFGMNISDPLWNTPSHSSNSPTSVTTTQPPSTGVPSAQPEQLIKLFRKALTSTTSSMRAPSTSGSDFSQSQTDQIVDAITNNGGSHLWTFKSFWYIAVIVTAITIMLPLVAGKIFRAVLQFTYYYPHYWQIAVFSGIFVTPIVLDETIPPIIFLGIFGIPQCLLLAAQSVKRLGRFGRKKKRWAGYATIFAVCVGVDLPTALFSADASNIRHFHRFGRNTGLTGILPPLYLFILWIQPTSSFFTKDKILRLIDAFLPNFIKNSDFNTRHPFIFYQALAIALEGVNACLSILLPGFIYILGTSVPIFLYGLNGLSCASSPSLIVFWMIYFAILGSSILAWLQTILFSVGSVALFPLLYVILSRWAYPKLNKAIQNSYSK